MRFSKFHFAPLKDWAFKGSVRLLFAMSPRVIWKNKHHLEFVFDYEPNNEKKKGWNWFPEIVRRQHIPPTSQWLTLQTFEFEPSGNICWHWQEINHSLSILKGFKWFFARNLCSQFLFSWQKNRWTTCLHLLPLYKCEALVIDPFGVCAVGEHLYQVPARTVTHTC